MIRALIADDEQPARDRLRQLLSAIPDVEVAGEAADGEQAVEQIRTLRPDLVFLDIQMPGCGGLEAAASLPSPRPDIIFCTAYDHYAVDAFELHAVDYLLKPVNRARLAEAVDRVRQAPHREPRIPAPERFLAKSGAKYRVIPQSEVSHFASEGGLTKLCTRHAHYWMDPTLNDLEDRLDPALFFRASRAALIKLDEVAEVAPMPGGSGEAVLKCGARIEVSRRRYRPLLDALGGIRDSRI